MQNSPDIALNQAIAALGVAIRDLERLREALTGGVRVYKPGEKLPSYNYGDPWFYRLGRVWCFTVEPSNYRDTEVYGPFKLPDAATVGGEGKEGV